MHKDPTECDLMTALALLDRSTLEYPGKEAIRFKHESCSYTELHDRVDAQTRQLIQAGVVPGSRVAIAVERSIEMVVAVFAAWRAGAAIVPIDLEHPPARRDLILEDASPQAIIGFSEQLPELARSGATLIECDAVSGTKADAARASFVPAERDIAYVMYTSGTTGTPKGVQVSHGALSRFFSAIQQHLGMRETDRMLAITTITFDISILEIVLPLVSGATLIVGDRHIGGDGRRLAAALDDEDATFLQATPATWRLLLDAGWTGKPDLTIMCGGETLHRRLAEDLLTRGARVFNVYGPTETTIWATIEQVSHGDGPVPIGTALPGYETRVLDEALQPVSGGHAGQLFIGGGCLAEGYLNRPEETGQRFITAADGKRLYATGDLVRELADGKLEFIGRNDSQVKIRGFRIELGEIESHLAAVESVKDAVVLPEDEGSGETKLSAYLIMEDGADTERLDLRGQLASALPRHMIPHYFTTITEFPRTPNNKIDRNRLAAMRTRHELKPEVPIEDPLELFIWDIWSRVLNIRNIAVDEDFFDLGGDSIQAAMITNHIQDRLGEVVWPVAVFDAPTVSQLADYLRRSYPSAVAECLPSVKLVSSELSNRPVDEALLAKFRALTKPPAPFPPPVHRNPRAVFILTPPRSGSTLLRVMLAGHPSLFAPPEIELLSFNTMGERAREFEGRESYRLEGTIRAVMEILQCDAERARSEIAEYERMDMPVSRFYGVLQTWLGERTLVDKTPANCLNIEVLRRAEEYFENPLYVHLTRHPFGMIRSFLKARLWEVFFRRVDHDFSPRELAELVWLHCHENILEFLECVPDQRRIRVRFEDLTADPGGQVSQLCDFLGIDPNEEMLTPQRNKDGKMTDGLHAVSKMMGDPKFHQHRKIDAAVAEAWKEEMREESLGPVSRNVARVLGYEVATVDEQPRRDSFVL